MKNSILCLILVAANAASAFAQAAASPLSRIGVAAAVRGSVKAAAPGAIGRIVESGKPLYLNDHVTTDAQGRLQILLADETVFTIGPSADIVLDKFVYDPTTGAGAVAAQIVRGAFRFVTGRIARLQPSSMKVRLNVGTIGVRGTVVVGETDENSSTVINAGAGNDNDANEPPSAIDVTNAGVTVHVFHTGEGVTFLRNGAPSNPVPMGAALDRISGVLGSKPGHQVSSRLLDGPASDRSGHSTSRGQYFAGLDADFAALAANANSVQTNASQIGGNGLPDGLTTWQALAMIPGSGVYSGAGTYACTGGLCGGSGSANFTLDVSFASRLLTGGSIALGASGSFPGDSGNFAPTSFPSSGNAILTVSGSNFSNTNFNSTTVSFENKGGVPAGAAALNLNYTNSSFGVSGSGSVVGTR